MLPCHQIYKSWRGFLQWKRIIEQWNYCTNEKSLLKERDVFVLRHDFDVLKWFQLVLCNKPESSSCEDISRQPSIVNHMATSREKVHQSVGFLLQGPWMSALHFFMAAPQCICWDVCQNFYRQTNPHCHLALILNHSIVCVLFFKSLLLIIPVL